ncbi:MAG: restriction endonuclease subunit S [Fibrobacter sp.]|nr:restriction endonuclease subunit S [Fibrobacter sp.]
MNGKQLKNSILQWAIQGKLVPQNPKDEPASKLLERIAAQRVVASGAKQSKKNPASRIYRDGSSWFEQVGSAEPKDITEEIPFDIPESWEWCRLKNLAIFLNGDRSKNYPNKSEYVPNGVAWINTGHITPDGYLSTSSMNYISEEKFNSLGNGFIEKGDLVYCLRGATYGKIARIDPFERGAIASSLMIIRPLQFDFREYIYWLLISPYAKQQLNIYANGAAQPNLAAKDIEKYFVPLPPLAEQKRIVKKLEQILPLVDEYDQAQTQLDKLNKELPEALKKSILQQAIQGKLVPQNPKDEPADKLLERITISRHSSHSEESSKKSRKSSSKNPVSRIYRDTDGLWYEQTGSSEPIDISEEIPFEIPETWTWCRLENLGTFVRGSGIKRDETVLEGRPCVRYGEMYTTYKVKFSVVKSFTRDDIFEKCQKIVQNDILMALTGENKWDIALAAVYQGIEELALGGDLCKFTPIECNPLYLVYLINSPYGIEYKRNTSTGDIIVHTSVGKLGNFLVPLPPLTEQKRVVAKLEQMFKVL